MRRTGGLLLALVAVAAAPGLSGPPRAGADEHPVLLAAGDISRCDSKTDERTAALIQAAPEATVAALGDLVEGFAPNEFEDCFAPSWGRFKDRIFPALGDQEYFGGEVDDYFAYFGARAGERRRGWYSYDLGAWHVVVLNSACSAQLDHPPDRPLKEVDGGCEADSPQVEWLRADLAAHPGLCSVAYFHEPIIDKPDGGTRGSMRPLTELLYDSGVDVVLAGHRHTYRRYAPIGLDGRADDRFGIRQFIVGTGGHTQRDDQLPHGVLEVAHAGSNGLLRLTLRPDGYDWRFAAAEPGDRFRDAGSESCHGAPGGQPRPAPAPTTTAPPGTTPPPPAPAGAGPQPAARKAGYWMLGADGVVYAFGDARHVGEPAARLAGEEAADLEPTPSYDGYWVVDGRGRVHAFGDAPPLGGADASALAAGERVTSLSTTPTGAGYWLFTSRGRVFAFGDAGHAGDMSGVALNGPVLDSIPTPTGRGYYMVGADGGIFTFGDATFAGSMGGTPLNAPVQSLVPDADGAGYWLVAADGGIFAFDAPFRGSMGDRPLNRPVTGMVRFGNGYLMVGEDGGIFNFSDREFLGSLGAAPPARPVVSVAALDG